MGHTSDDETGLLYTRARYMDPATGRFVSEDAARDGVHWYWYCDANPVDRVDPAGERSLLQWIRELLAAAMLGRDICRRPPKGAVKPQQGLEEPVDPALDPRNRDLRSGVMAISSIDAHFQRDPLDVAAILADIAGEHEVAAEIDRLNERLKGW